MKGTIIVLAIVICSALAYSMTDMKSAVLVIDQRSTGAISVDTGKIDNGGGLIDDDSMSKAGRDCLPDDIEIVWSYPAEGFVDVRTPQSSDGKPVGIMLVDVEFDRKVELHYDCVQLISTADNVPEIVSIAGEGTYWTIELDRPIPAGHSTAVAFGGGRTSLVYHSRPGDVNGDGTVDEGDVAALEMALEVGTPEIDEFDVDGNGSLDDADFDGLARIVDNYQSRNDWQGKEGNSDGKIICCCSHGACVIMMADACPTTMTPISCPCVPNPCPPESWPSTHNTLVASARK